MTSSGTIGRSSVVAAGSLVASFLGGIVASVLIAVGVWLLVAYTPLGAALAWVLPGGERGPWYLTRAAGTVAYLLLTGSTVWGLLLSTKMMKELVPPPLALALHSSLSWLAIGVTSVHAGALLFDNYYRYALADLLVPFLGPYRPAWVGLGTITLYGMILTAGSFSVRKWIGNERWRRLHYLSFSLFVLVTLHGLMAGTDSAQPGMRAMYLASTLLVLFLTNYRLLAGRPKQKRPVRAGTRERA